jgi:LysR family nitrogen assimilation transcriptional regulator
MSDAAMDLPQLRTLIQVAELGSLNKASDRVRIAQPALSRQIRLLEEELHTQLFVRHGRGMMLTSAGDKVLARAYRIMREVGEIKSDIASDRTNVVGKVAIGLPPTIGEVITVPFARAVQERYPEIRIQFSPGFGGHLIEWLQRGDIDLAVLYDPRPLKSVRGRPLLTEGLHVVGSADAALSVERPMSFAAFANWPLVLPTAKHSLRALAELAARSAALSLNVRHEVESLATTRDLVRSGAGLTILPMWSIRSEIAAGRMSAAPLIDPPLSRSLMLACSTDRVLSHAGQVCEDLFIKLVGRLESEGAIGSVL